jgi:hypothetical protein
MDRIGGSLSRTNGVGGNASAMADLVGVVGFFNGVKLGGVAKGGPTAPMQSICILNFQTLDANRSRTLIGEILGHPLMGNEVYDSSNDIQVLKKCYDVVSFAAENDLLTYLEEDITSRRNHGAFVQFMENAHHYDRLNRQAEVSDFSLWDDIFFATA